jgi:hypothetical protein
MGHPKGVVLPHRQILWSAINSVISWGLSENDVSFGRVVRFPRAIILRRRTNRTRPFLYQRWRALPTLLD